MMRDVLKLLPFAIEDWERVAEANEFLGAHRALETELFLAYGVRCPFESQPEEWRIPPRTVFTEVINRGFRLGWVVGAAIQKHIVQQRPPGESIRPQQAAEYDDANEDCWTTWRQVGFEEWADHWPDSEVTLPTALKVLASAAVLQGFRACLKTVGLADTAKPSLN